MAHIKGHVAEDLLIGATAEEPAVPVSAGDVPDGEHQLL